MITQKRIKKCLKSVEEEILWYKPKKRIADAMRELAKMGFRPCGHGCGFGGEDFSLVLNISKKEYYDFNLCDQGNKIVACFAFGDYEDVKVLKEGTIGKTLAFAKQTILNLK